MIIEDEKKGIADCIIGLAEGIYWGVIGLVVFTSPFWGGYLLILICKHTPRIILYGFIIMCIASVPIAYIYRHLNRMN